jgi:tripartite-type tricarboxylate transporter receptor subunit TctC
MRQILWLILSLSFATAATGVHAQATWPDRPVQFIVPLSAGGTADGVARVIAGKLSEMWGQRVYVDNRAGGNTIIGTEALAKANPDGYTIGLGVITSQAANPFLFEKLPYSSDTDFAPIALLAISPIFLIVHPSVPANNLQEFIAYAKANPDKLSFATTGHGSSFHLATEQFMQRVGIKMVHIPYKGMGTAVLDLVAGNVQVALDVSTMAQVHAGKLKTLGVVSEKRFEGEPSIPSFAEQGVTGLEVNTWLSLHAPAKLDPALQKKINADVNAVLAMPDVLTTFLTAERKKIGGIIKAANIKVQQ